MELQPTPTRCYADSGHRLYHHPEEIWSTHNTTIVVVTDDASPDPGPHGVTREAHDTLHNEQVRHLHAGANVVGHYGAGKPLMVPCHCADPRNHWHQVHPDGRHEMQFGPVCDRCAADSDGDAVTCVHTRWGSDPGQGTMDAATGTTRPGLSLDDSLDDALHVALSPEVVLAALEAAWKEHGRTSAAPDPRLVETLAEELASRAAEGLTDAVAIAEDENRARAVLGDTHRDALTEEAARRAAFIGAYRTRISGPTSPVHPMAAAWRSLTHDAQEGYLP